MIRFFRRVAILEGTTNLFLFLVAIPLKYGFDNPVLVPWAGRVHGIAWIVYMVVMAVALWGRGSIRAWVQSTMAALVPFGTFVNDHYLRRIERRAVESRR